MNGPDALDFGRASVTNIGNPHCVLAVADVAALKLEPLGKGIVRPLPSQRELAFPSSAETPTYVAHSHWGRGRPSANGRIALAARKGPCAVVAPSGDIARRPAALSAGAEALEMSIVRKPNRLCAADNSRGKISAV